MDKVDGLQLLLVEDEDPIHRISQLPSAALAVAERPKSRVEYIASGCVGED